MYSLNSDYFLLAFFIDKMQNKYFIVAPNRTGYL